MLLVASLAVVAPAGAPAAGVRAQQADGLSVTVDRTQVTVGDRIAVTVVLRLPAGAQPDLAALEQQFGELDVLVIGLPVEQAIAGGLKEIRIRYEVAAFRPGAARVPPLTVGFTAPDGSPAAATSAPVPLDVVSVIPPGDAADAVRDLKPQIELPFSTGTSPRTAAAAALVAVVLVGAGLLSWRLVRQRRPVPAPPAAIADASPEAAARAELDRISALGLLESGDLEQLHALLAACIRRYLSERYGFPAFAMTTTELHSRMERHGVGRWQARLTTGLLSECDAVTYARYRPAPARAESNLAMAYEVVGLNVGESMPPAPMPV